MLPIFDFPKNTLIRKFALPFNATTNTRFILSFNKFIFINTNTWYTVDQDSEVITNSFPIVDSQFESFNNSPTLSIIAIIKNQPLIPITPSSYQAKIAQLNSIDGSIEKYLAINGFNATEKLLDLCADNQYIYFLTEINNTRQIKKYNISNQRLNLVTTDVNNLTQICRIKINDNNLLLLDNIENSIYVINKINGKTIFKKQQLGTTPIVDFDIKYNNLFVINYESDSLYQYSLSPEYAHLSLQTNVYDLAANGTNQSLVRASIFSESNEFLPQQPISVLNLQPLDLLTQYTKGQYVSLIAPNTLGNKELPLYTKNTSDSLYLNEDSYWEFILEDFKLIQQIRINFDQFRPGDIKVQVFTTNNEWKDILDTTLPLLFTREELVIDNFFGETNVTIAGIKIINTSSNVLSLRRVLLLELPGDQTELAISNYSSDTAQTLFYVSSVKTPINELSNPRFDQGRVFWQFKGLSYLVQETVLEGDIGAFLHSTGDNTETYIKQTINLNQATPQVITASIYVKASVIEIPNPQDLGLKITLRDNLGNEQDYFRAFPNGQYPYRRFFITIIPENPVFEVDYQIICQKSIKGSIEIDKLQLEQNKLSTYSDPVSQRIFVKCNYQF